MLNSDKFYGSVTYTFGLTFVVEITSGAREGGGGHRGHGLP